MKVSPNVAFAPANVIVRTNIAANPANRSIEIVAESQSFYRSSEIQLDGDQAPRTTRLEFRSLPPGAYTVRATLKTNDEDIISVREEVNVVDSGSN